MSWTPGDQSHLDWIESASVESSDCGYDVGPMPDAVLVLHPIYARVDGTRLGRRGVGDWCSGPLPAAYRRVAWREYAEHRQVPMFTPGRGIGLYSLPGIWEDPYVLAPTEGDLRDPEVWDAVLDVLIAHSPSGTNAECTIFYTPFPLHNPSTAETDPHILRGRLGDHRELFDHPLGYSTPQNLWPDDHGWVLFTDYDAWATQISGPTELIDALHRAPELDTVRLGDLP